jgi:hypothetical protein
MLHAARPAQTLKNLPRIEEAPSLTTGCNRYRLRRPGTVPDSKKTTRSRIATSVTRQKTTRDSIIFSKSSPRTDPSGPSVGNHRLLARRKTGHPNMPHSHEACKRFWSKCSHFGKMLFVRKDLHPLVAFWQINSTTQINTIAEAAGSTPGLDDRT